MRRADQVAEAIAQDIRSGLLGSGAWLKQVDLETRYQASRGDVRRALDILVVRRLVQQIPDRGFYVLEVDERRQRELREVRVLLEVGSAAGIVEAATPEILDKLTEAAGRFSDAVASGTVVEQYESNHQFHVTLTDLCANRELVSLIIELRGNLPATRLRQWQSVERAKKSADEHFEMIEAIRRGDVNDLQNLFRLHIQQP